MYFEKKILKYIIHFPKFLKIINQDQLYKKMKNYIINY